MTRIKSLFVVLAIAATVAVANAAETTTVHYIGAGSSAMFQGFGVAANNDLANAALCVGGVIQAGFPSSSAIVGNACSTGHWSAKTSSGLAALKDSRSLSIP